MRLGLLLACLLLATPAAASPHGGAAALAAALSLPHQRHRLANGLELVVHTDRTSPLVFVGVWYRVGSRHEPLGQSGYAHLFEHLMFYGSAHSPQPHMRPLEALGATGFNGTTNQDRTNYFQTVPRPALERALFLEADRMGFLLPALDQARLDQQRAVVLQEKAEADDRPFGLMPYALWGSLFAPEHPLSVPPIGREDDLRRATLDDARAFFRTHYGPNNAILVLAGDIDIDEARPLVERWFGGIAPGPLPPRLDAVVPAARGGELRLVDRVPGPRLVWAWPAPPRGGADAVALTTALAVLAQGATSRLRRALVDEEGLALAVGGGASALATAGMATISVDPRPDADPEVVRARAEALVAGFVARGPTADEVERVAMRAVSGEIRGWERLGGLSGRGAALAEALLHGDDAGFAVAELRRFATLSAGDVAAAAQRWLSAPALRIRVDPGPRQPQRWDTTQRPRRVADRGAPPPAFAPPADQPDRTAGPPPEGEPVPLTWAEPERFRLSGGLEVRLVRRPGLPVVRVALVRDAGVAADDAAQPGTQAMMLRLIGRGSEGALGPLDAADIAARLERLGALVGASAGLDTTRFSLNALAPQLEPALALFADLVLAPSFPPAELELARAQALRAHEAERLTPGGLARVALPGRLFGERAPYGGSWSGTGTRASLTAIDRDGVRGFHAGLEERPGVLLVVGDVSRGQLQPLLERAFGRLSGAGRPPAARPTGEAPGRGRILLVDRPGALQAELLAGAPLGATGADDLVPADVLNDVLGGTPTALLASRVREQLGLTYGISSGLVAGARDGALLVSSALDPARVAQALAETMAVVHRLGGAPDEALLLARDGQRRALAGRFETGAAVIAALEEDWRLARPAGWWPDLARRLETLAPGAVRSAGLPNWDRFTWVVVGEAALLGPQLQPLGLPVDVISAEALP